MRLSKYMLIYGVGLLALNAMLLAAATPQAPVQPTVTTQQAEYFETNVRPVLVEKCYSCHSDKNKQGDLRLDSRASIISGGGSGSAIVPGDPDKSLLIRAIHYNGSVKMPPAGKLKLTEITALTEWVRMGAPWPTAKTLPGGAGSTSPKPKHWAFQPIRRTSPPQVKGTAWIKSPIDRYILAKLEAKGLTPAPQADRRTLIRRVTFDLTGLPPAPEEIDAFLADRSPNALETVIDRLLASAAYGERWGRHWLDVARYADSKGYVFTEDSVYHNAYTYRDWVVRAYNEDLPYDQFIIQQLAADKLPLGDDHRPLAALGFLTVGRRFLNDPVFINDDRIDVTCRGLMALTVGCARCHNHKFDPIPSKDYYALYGVFASSFEPNPPLPISPKAISEPYEKHNALIRSTQEHKDSLVRDQVNRLRGVVEKNAAGLPQEIRTILQSIRPEVLPNDGQLARLQTQFDATSKRSISDDQARIAELQRSVPPAPEFAMAMQDTDRPFDPYIFIRGNPGNRGEAVTRHFLECASPEPPQSFTGGSGRLELAKAIASRDNPLTARVIANRIWMYHFGAALVRTPGDFGTRGEQPTHSELLDWLANSLIDHGWSIKNLHKQILLSSAYQQGSLGTPKAFLADPENRLLSHQNRQRLDLEALRDSVLAVSGALDRKVGGPAVDITSVPYAPRRTLYGFIDRQNLQGLFRTFDFASPDTSSAQRYRTTVPQQALFMMNSPFLVDQAKALAHRSDITASGDLSQRIIKVYRCLFGRQPAPDELKAGVQFMNSGGQVKLADSKGAGLTTWEAYCQALLMTNEFSFVD